MSYRQGLTIEAGRCPGKQQPEIVVDVSVSVSVSASEYLISLAGFL